jgi:D-glycero-D-manno-heptose 1,7-bisphosphate phosphatase
VIYGNKPMRIDSKPTPYVVFDRDGTIIDLVHHLKELNEINIKSDAVEALIILKTNGFRFGVITNQSVIGRGLTSLDNVKSINLAIANHFASHDIIFDFFLICPHNPKDKCECRKPKIELGLKAMEQFGLSPQKSYYVGDTDSDMRFALDLGWTGVQITQHFSPSELACYHTNSLLEASKWVVQDFKVI